MKLYISVDGDDIGAKIGRARLADDEELVRRTSFSIERGQEIWKSWALLTGGSVVEAGGDEILVEVPADKVSDLPRVKSEYESAVGATCSVGVGMKISESSKALLAAKLKGKNQILFYNDEVEQLIAKAKEQQQKTEEEKIGDEYLGKAAPAMNVGAGAGFGGVTPPSKPTVDAPTPTQGEHSEGEALQALLDDPDRPPAPEMTHAAADFERQLHDEATRGEGEDADRAAQSINNVEGVKQQIARALQVIKVQQPVLEQVKQASPQLYQAITGLTQSVIALAREISPMSKAEKKQSPAELMAGAVRDSSDPVSDHDCKKGDCYVQSEALHHLLGGEQSGWEPHHVFEGSKGPHWFLKHSATGRVLDTLAGDSPTPRPYHRGKRQDFISKEPSKQARATIAIVLSGKPLAKAEKIGKIPKMNKLPTISQPKIGGQIKTVQEHLPLVRQIRANHDKAVFNKVKHLPLHQRAQICYRVAPDIEKQTGLEHVAGMYAGPEVEGHDEEPDYEGDRNYYHDWNRHPDGTIVDATADQFGEKDPVRVIPPGDERQDWYNDGPPMVKSETMYCTACKDPLDKDGHCKVKAHWEKLDKGALPMPKASAHHVVKLPVGSTEGNKVKVQHNDGSSSWVQVGAGQIQSQDPAIHPISSRNPSGR